MTSDWRSDAACADTADVTYATRDPFFPEATHRGGPANPYATARAICQGCPVRAICLTEALLIEGVTLTRAGMFGGLTPAERYSLANNGQKPTSRQQRRMTGTPVWATA